MIHGLTLTLALLFSTTAFANPLVGKWTGGCNDYSVGSNESVVEFGADSSWLLLLTDYSTSDCSGSGKSEAVPGTYAVTGADLFILARSARHKFEMSFKQSLTTDTLVLIPTSLKVDGKDHDVTHDLPVTLKRK